jgi:hypothetical protein
MTGTVVVFNPSNVDSGDYVLAHKVYDTETGIDVYPGSVPVKNLPGNKRRHESFDWKLASPGDYVVNFTLFQGGVKIDSKEIPFTVRTAARITADEYPGVMLLALVVLIPVGAYFFLKKREEKEA